MKIAICKIVIGLAVGLLSANAIAEDSWNAAPVCEGFGPQAPRDIDSAYGKNKRIVSLAPSASQMNLCNMHFHINAEHKAKDFAIFAGPDKGYQCSMSKHLSPAELKPTKEAICKGIDGELKPGDTIEVHWVHTSCDVTPGAGLGSCVSAKCLNPQLRVESQVFTLVNDRLALNFNNIDYDGNMLNGYHQAKSLPVNTGKPVEFNGSTTGEFHNDQTCSPLHVTWGVRPQCAKLDINTVGDWCKSNEFSESHAHGVRKLVTNPSLLSKIRKGDYDE